MQNLFEDKCSISVQQILNLYLFNICSICFEDGHENIYYSHAYIYMSLASGYFPFMS